MSVTVQYFWNVEERRYPPNTGKSVLTEIDRIIILESVVEKPEMYLREIHTTPRLRFPTCPA